MRFLKAEALEPGMILGRDIVSPGQSFMLKKGVKLTREYVDYLNRKGYLGAYITEEENLDVEIEEPLSQNTLSESVKAVSEANISELMSSARHIVKDISNLKHLSIDLLDLRSFDEYTYRHSVNVAVYSVAIAKYMHLSDEELEQVALAGVCHDLGKRKIPTEIINKPGSLTDEEFNEIKNHPKYSYDLLQSNHEISPVVRQAVLCHHENENGSGYPTGKTGKDLNLLTKILHAADVYDALISRRPYKTPYTPLEAFEYLVGGEGILFSEKVVEAMRKVIPTYPIATDVILSTGEKAVVVAHTKDPLRPVVRVLGTNYNMDLSNAAYANVLIVSSGVADGAGFGGVEELNEKRQTVKEKKINIMLVDDSIISLQSTSNALANEKYNIIALQSGFAAMNYIREQGIPDLIIMDIEMPHIDGIETVTAIREMGYTDVPIIFLTSNTSKETVIKCFSVHAKDYIAKPVLPVYLRERVAIALDASRERY